MPRYHVYWSKCYRASGEFEIEADSPDEADRTADDMLGDQTGSLDYDPSGDYVEVMEISAPRIVQ